MIVIKNGTIIDGSDKTERFKADILVNKEKIAKIGNLGKEKADLIIDASGLYVAPGFIDVTTHSDNHWTLFSQPKQESFIKQGIATILGGHGGSSLAPIIKKEALKTLEKWIDISKININWQTVEEFFSEIEKHNLTVNFATLVGHENLRQNVLGSDIRPATEKEIEQINVLLETALRQGAFGLSTNLGSRYGQPASKEEITTLLKTIAEHEGISMHHLENEGKELLPAISRLITFLRSSNARGHISHLKALGRSAWENFGNALNMIELARKEDVYLTCDFFPYTSTGSSLTSLLPSWILGKNQKEITKLLKDKKIQQELIEHLEALTLHYDKIIIASTLRDTASVGKSIEQLSQISGLANEKVLLDLLVVNELQVSIFNEVILEENLEILSKKPYAMIASDGVGYEIEKIKNLKSDLPHPRSFGSFPKILKEFVKEKKLLTWEEAIYKMSGLPAKVLGIKDRGILKKGNYADIVILNPNTIKDKSTYDKPLQYSEGIEYVFINGQLTLERGVLTEESAGQILRKK